MRPASLPAAAPTLVSRSLRTPFASPRPSTSTSADEAPHAQPHDPLRYGSGSRVYSGLW
jgi:hypothetical protein